MSESDAEAMDHGDDHHEMDDLDAGVQDGDDGDAGDADDLDGDGEHDVDDGDLEDGVGAPLPVRKPRAPRRKPDVDPARPKAPRTAFMEFTNDHRQELLDDQPDLAKNVKEIASIMGQRWRDLRKEEQDRYKTEYAEKKRVYDSDLESYFAANPGAKELEVEAKRRRKAEVSKKRSRAAKAAGVYREKGPKKPLIPFFFFVMKQRSIVKAEMPGAKPTEITKAVAERWRGLTDDDKKEFQLQADEDKLRYQRECDEVGYHPPASKRARRSAAARAAPVMAAPYEADPVDEDEPVDDMDAPEEELEADAHDEGDEPEEEGDGEM